VKRYGFVSLTVIFLLTHAFARAQETAKHPLTTQAEYERWQKELSNWGRWGKDDELGTLNLITPAKRKQAAALVKEGFSVSLARDASAAKDIDNPCPIEWAMTMDNPGTVMDRIGYPCIHGPGTTHLDSFAHIFFRWQDVERRQEDAGDERRRRSQEFYSDDEEWDRNARGPV
jgi:hypothetical protein